VRYNSDGSLDTSLNSSGKVTTAVGTGTCKGEGVALQEDGKIVVVGYSFNAPASRASRYYGTARTAALTQASPTPER
jgi:hypothetical protein